MISVVEDASMMSTAQNKMHFSTKLFELVVFYEDFEAENMLYITKLLKRSISRPCKEYLNAVLV